MNYHIVLSPELALIPEEVVAAWNETEECRQAGQARLVPTGGTRFDGALLYDIVIGVSTGVVSNALFALLMKALSRRTPPKKHLHFEERKQADGSSMVVLDVDE